MMDLIPIMFKVETQYGEIKTYRTSFWSSDEEPGEAFLTECKRTILNRLPKTEKLVGDPVFYSYHVKYEQEIKQYEWR